MIAPRWLAAVSIGVALAAPLSLGAEENLFGFTDGDHPFFLSTLDEVDQGKCHLGVNDGGDLVFTTNRGDRFEKEGATIRARLEKEQIRTTRTVAKNGEEKTREEVVSRPKEVLEKDGWYLTGDYSGDTPRVVLTKEPTKYSRWTFVKSERLSRNREGKVRCLKNENDQGKDAWLSIEEKSTDDKGGSEVCRSILSFEKRMPFFLEDRSYSK